MLPPDFLGQMEALLPDFSAFKAAFNTPPPTSIRLNPFKVADTQLTDAVPWCQQAYYLSQRPSFTLDPRFHAGAYYVQDASCMLLEAALKQLELQPQRILDACAAPGGKSTHLASLFPDSLIVANELIRSRARILADNLSAWGSGNVLVSRNDPNDFAQLPEFFDLIVVDAPCSGEGLFRRDPKASAEWSAHHVVFCQQRQERILNALWPALKSGGILIYCTCTYNTKENRQALKALHIQGAEMLNLKADPHWGVDTTAHQDIPGWQAYPHRLRGEGFYLTAVRKPEPPMPRIAQSRSKPKQHKQSKTGLSPQESQEIQSWLQGQWCFNECKDEIVAWPAHWQADRALLQKLDLLQAPLACAERKGKHLRPSHSLAQSIFFKKEAFPQAELTQEAAIAYLQGEALFQLPVPQGYVLLRSQGFALGWGKQTTAQANNLYPPRLRIRMRPSIQEQSKLWAELHKTLPLSPL